MDTAGYVPAPYEEVITVSALADSDDAKGRTTWKANCTGEQSEQEETVGDFANVGAPADIVTPGVCILST